MAKPKLLIYITKSCTHLNIRKTCAKFCNIGLTNAHHPCHCNTARFFWEVTAVKIAATLLEMEEKVGNKSKGRILNRFFKKTKHVKFSEKRTFLTKEMFVFLKIWRALFSWNTRFEIRSFALLPARITKFIRVVADIELGVDWLGDWVDKNF